MSDHNLIDNDRITTMVEDIFAITLNADKFVDANTKKPDYIQIIYLEELAESLKPQKYIDIETLEQALFERLMISNITEFVLPKSCKPPYVDFVVQNRVILYLHSAYGRLKQYGTSNNKSLISVVEKMKNLIIRNVCTAMEQPDIFQDQVIWEQWLDIIRDTIGNTGAPPDFLLDVLGALDGQENGFEIVKSSFTPILVHLHRIIALTSTNLLNLEYWLYTIILMFASHISLAKVLLEYATPKSNDGRAYAETIFGAFLSLSILPRGPFAPYEYFENPLEQQLRNPMEGTLWSALEHLGDQMHAIFLKLLRLGGEIRSKTLDWIGACLHSNNTRGQLWSTQIIDIDPTLATCVSDAFMLNLGSVLLRMCRPFCKDYKDGKALRIDPTYGAVEEQDRIKKSVHMKALSNDTCLLPAIEGQPRPTSDQYSFTTECYFMTQKCLDIGYRVCVERLTKQNQDMARMQRAYNDARDQGSPAANHLLQRMTQDMTKYLSLRSALFEPSMMQLLQELHTSTAAWIIQVSINESINELRSTSSDQLCNQTESTKGISYAPMTFRDVKFPLPEVVPDTLRCIPEFVIENTICFFPFVRHFNNMDFYIEKAGSLEPLLTMVLVFMGSNSRMMNPHLRAKLAECLESLLPHLKEDQAQLQTNPLNVFARQRLFNEHPHRLQIVSSLLNVFVGIEMTGQSVQFEQKFNYRRPMYVVMDYLWQLEEHRKCFHNLALDAEKNMEATDPPIFLRFANLLLNDAVFLLDESLSNMAQLRTMQSARINGEWNNLSAPEREQNIGNIQRIGMMARFDNILGRETIHTIQYLTSEVRGVFCHSSMVDRVASMLNYFLLHLVGPNKKNFKVKDSQDYDFDPASTVLNICRIYVNLSNSDAFCLAVSQDGRSYSQQLFVLAEDVLARIGGGPLIGDLRVVADRVHELAEKQQREEEALAEAPEEFLDPIMSTLMTDPVILPSSRTTVDRATIARHLLSDQTDPFNRSPLSMDLVKSNTELKQRIEEWIKERKKLSSIGSNTNVTAEEN